jgi:hypothetical protein
MVKQDYLRKLYFKQWVIGLISGDIREIIRTKNFRQDDIKWILPGSAERFYADPFVLNREKGKITIIYEDFSIDEHYGNISVMTLNDKYEIIDTKVLLDTGIHVSFPYVFKENNKIFVFPESVRHGSISCYEYNAGRKSLICRGEIMKAPLYDPAIVKLNDKYWLFGSEFESRREYKLHVFHSEKLTGPYIPLRGNPVRSGLNGVRGAGSFIEVDGDIYRPAQNCEKEYGESITINRLKVLDEHYFSEEPYMTISVSRKSQEQNNIHNIHTINFSGDIIVVDGMKWTFSLKEQWKNFRRNRKLLSQTQRIEP